MKSRAKFHVGDFVFAKVRGYPPWPAKIIKNKSFSSFKKFQVYFYGTGETALVWLDKLYPFESNRAKFANAHNFKRDQYRIGMEQIDVAIKGSAPISLPTASVGPRQASDTLNSLIKKEEDETPEVVGVEQESLAVAVCIDTTGACDSDAKRPHESNPEQAPGETTRADREPKAEVCMSVKKHAKNIVIYNNIMLAHVYRTNNCVGVKLDFQKPAQFATLHDKVVWEENAFYEAHELKLKIEGGYVHPDVVVDRLVKNPTKTRMPPEEKLIEGNLTLLHSERHFLELCMKIRQCLSVKKADTKRVIELLKNFGRLYLTQVMLLRNHKCMEIMRQLCHYVGNLRAWDLSVEQKIEFMRDTEIIRSEAKKIYNNFKKIFGFKGKIPFLDEFSGHVEAYKQLVQAPVVKR